MNRELKIGLWLWGFSAVGFMVWGIHLHPHIRGSEGILDLLIHLFSLLGKALALPTTVFWALPRMMMRLHGHPSRALLIFAVTALLSVAWLGSATAMRPVLEELCNDATMRYIPQNVEDTDHLMWMADRLYWPFISAWESGKIWWTEVTILAMYPAGLCLFGLVMGRGLIFGTIWSLLWTAFLAYACIITEMSIWDFDMFFAGTVTGPLPVELLLPVVSTNFTCTTWPLFLIWMGSALLAFALWPARDPLPPPPDSP